MRYDIYIYIYVIRRLKVKMVQICNVLCLEGVLLFNYYELFMPCSERIIVTLTLTTESPANVVK